MKVRSDAPPERKSIVFLARSLDRGGAERQLVLLADRLKRAGWKPAVITFYAGGAFRPTLEAAGVRVIDLSKRSRWDVLGFAVRLVRVIRRERPAVLHSYLTLPNVVAALVMPLLPRLRLVWGVRATHLDVSQYDWLTRVADRLERALADRPDLIILNSRVGKEHVVAKGYPVSKLVVISNGVDANMFRPDAARAQRTRLAWSIDPGVIVIGLVARLDPMKDHHGFLRAASIVVRARADVRIVCVGDGPAEYAAELRRLGSELHLDHALIWAGARDDMHDVNNAFDIACSSSRFGEGFPNAVVEAMACAVPCIVTDVGDSAWIVGDTGWVVPPRDPKRLAEALLAAAAESRQPGYPARRAAARRRVLKEFSVDSLVSSTIRELSSL